MSDGCEKPFEATPQRIVKAKREGNVARTSELGANLSFAAAGLALVAVAKVFAAAASKSLTGYWSGASPAFNLLVAGVALIPICAAAIGGAFGYALQSGGLTITAIEPKFDRLDPMQGLKRILSR
jgi:flagellar biosynthesis protein FlhB